ncbi:HAD family hydrolase [Lichenihabitans sp. Uapishka_5]|uniref:HAD family hydrolase n=1 Tax=Lichenihabitans sp. Uapishka_5 TaxID=3037302 RepID=UPI0029E7F69F|nr:HAD family hydrolase [Lichenihabitans sp. Uapishka_5]MDX7949630.1 HAD family hydrolase [Lichenihabitans sp. Uapishka_5]
MSIAFIGLDADDTLWHNETIFRAAQARFEALMAPFASPERIAREIDTVERRNLSLYGYGAKGFTLSVLETALDLSHGAITGPAMAEVLALGRSMMGHPIEPLPGVVAAVERLSTLGRLVLITKGDLFHQEAKLAASGLGAWFAGVEVVSDKTPETYSRIFARYGVGAGQAVMAGNSVRSDVLPVLETGAYAALIPYPLVWSHEVAEVPHGHPRFRELSALPELIDWIEVLAAT